MYNTNNKSFVEQYKKKMYEKKIQTRNYIFSASNKRKIVKHLLKHGLFKTYLRKNCPYSYGLIKKDVNYFSDERIAVYTGVFGGYDNVYTPQCFPDNIDYFIFSDQVIQDNVWKYKNVEFPADLGSLSNAEKNRYVKMHPHLLFPEYRYTVYVDGSIEIITDLTEFIYSLNQYGCAFHMHYERNCAYQEIDKCIEQKKCSIDELTTFKQRLLNEGFPRNYGLLEAPVIVRDNNNPFCVSLMKQWWVEYKERIKRDQLALIYLIWKMGLSPEEFGTLGNDVHANYAFVHHSHK